MAESTSVNPITIRIVKLSDAQGMLDVYAPYVVSSHISFETEVPTLQNFEERIQKVSKRFPWWVAEVNGKIVGYAYASTFRERAAYNWALESSVYVADLHHGSVVAKSLYEKLFEVLKIRGTKQLIAVISVPSEKSVRFHEKMGFKRVGTIPSAGFKFEKWWDVLVMTKLLEDLPFSAPVI
jgi:L-amino acid N-acyltransferase YncA